MLSSLNAVHNALLTASQIRMMPMQTQTTERLAIVPAVLFLVAAVAPSASAQSDPATVRWQQKISSTEGGFAGPLSDGDRFGESSVSLGDLDGNGPAVDVLAVGARDDDTGGNQTGAVWLLFINDDGTVLSHRKIGKGLAGFTGDLGPADQFGRAVGCLGDLDGNGPSVVTLAVGATSDDDGGNGQGAVWLLFLDATGTVLSHQKISATEGGFTGDLDPYDAFGRSFATLGDLDGNGLSVATLAVGASGDGDGAYRAGAMWVLFLNGDGTVSSHQKISAWEGGFTGSLGTNDFFGWASTSVSDLNGDGRNELAIGSREFDHPIAPDSGATWILFLNPNGTVLNHQKIGLNAGGFTGTLHANDGFGNGLTGLGDIDGDGIVDLAIGAAGDANEGAVWVVFLNSDGTVDGHQKINLVEGGFPGPLDGGDGFGASLETLGDLDGDGTNDLVVGAVGDDDGGTGRGAVWVLFLNDDVLGTAYCHSASGCPCGNPDADAGCANSTGSGALLEASGSASVNHDDLVLELTDLPSNQLGILYMGGAQAQLPLGDGLRCVGSGASGVFRYYPPQGTGAGGVITLGPGIVAHTVANFGMSGQISAGQTWNFQGWYRDPAGPCGSGFNLSNAMEVSFGL